VLSLLLAALHCRKTSLSLFPDNTYSKELLYLAIYTDSSLYKGPYSIILLILYGQLFTSYFIFL